MNYTERDIQIALQKLGVSSGSNIFIHSNLTLFGVLKNCKDRHEFLRIWLGAVLSVIGTTGTVIFPTFSYSATTGKIFDPSTYDSPMGILSEALFKCSNSVRTWDPSYSFGAIGPKSHELLECDVGNSFSRKSGFGFLHREDFSIVCFNHIGTTFLHYIERCLNVDYRFDKKFAARILHEDKVFNTASTVYVRYLSDPNLAHNPYQYYQDGKKEGLIRSVNLGGGKINIAQAQDIFDFASRKIMSEKYYLTKAAYLKNFTPKIRSEKTEVDLWKN